MDSYNKSEQRDLDEISYPDPPEENYGAPEV